MVKRIKGEMLEDLTGVQFHAPALVAQLLRKYACREVYVDVWIVEEQRSDEQRTFLFGVLYEMIREHHLNTTGQLISHEHLHLWMCDKVWGLEVRMVKIDGREYYDIDEPDPDSWSKEVYSNRIEQITAFWAEKGMDIPDSKFIKSIN